MNQLTHQQKADIGFQYVLDALSPSSAYGAAMVKAAAPLEPGMEEELERQYRNIAKIAANRPLQGKLYDRLEGLFMQIKDLRPAMERCRKEVLGEVALFQLKGYLLTLEEIKPVFEEINTAARLEGITLDSVTPALDILDPHKSRTAAFYISEGYSAELTEIRRQKKTVEEALRLDRDNQGLMARRTEIVDREEAEEGRIREELCRKLAPWLDDMLANANAIGELDVTLQKAAIATQYGGVQPKLGEAIAFEAMTNPQLADGLAEEGKGFTPISIRLERGATVITGANMGGKSIALKTVALNVLLAACGFFPFAKQAEICLPDGMFLISENLEDTRRGLSSFGGEIVGFQEICRGGGEGAMILLDEFARGTNPEEGAMIVRGITRYLNACKHFSLLTTHYNGVALYGRAHYQVIGLGQADPEGLRHGLQAGEGGNPVELISRHMDYGLVPVEPGQSTPKNALHICRLLGLDEGILRLMDESPW